MKLGGGERGRLSWGISTKRSDWISCKKRIARQLATNNLEYLNSILITKEEEESIFKFDNEFRRLTKKRKI